MSGAKVTSDKSEAPVLGASNFRFSTESLPEQERVPVFREVFGRSILGMDFEPLGEQPFRTDMVVKQLPGLNIVWAYTTPVRAARTRQLLSDGKDSLAFEWSDGLTFGDGPGREVALQRNDGILISCSDPGSIVHASPGPMVSLTLPRDALTPMLKSLPECAGRPIPASTPALELLSHYVELLRRDSVTATPELQRLAVSHIYDLLALALAPARDTIERAKHRGLRAAQVAAIKDDIAQNLDRDFSVETIAARHRLTSRNVQRLFEENGTTFTAFVQEQRLHRAYRMLISRRFDHQSISEIAFTAGFNDLSWFNRLFRRRFGMAPGDVRNPSA